MLSQRLIFNLTDYINTNHLDFFAKINEFSSLSAIFGEDSTLTKRWLLGNVWRA